MSEEARVPPVGARLRLIGGELGTLVAYRPEPQTGLDVELDNGLPAVISGVPVPIHVDPSVCGEPGCKAWATVEGTRTTWALDHPRRAARRMDLGHTPFCWSHAPTVGDVWAAVRPIGEDELPLPGLGH